jgi:nanoRNase/pAp phosphatase (c-di-AMP/oligoRNAs hydrolase)
MNRSRRSDRLLKLLDEYEEVLALTHDNPDPDAVASCWALITLVRAKLDKPVRAVAGGAIVRAENRRMMELLSPPIEFVEDVPLSSTPAVVMIDCVPTARNHVLGAADMRPVAVIDHHALRSSPFRVRFRDIRPKVAATATILGQYLREQEVEPNPDLATALVYAIRTDASGQSDFSRTDECIARWLGAWVDHGKMFDIENAPLAREYYADLLLALESAFVYGDAALCFLPQAGNAEIVGEVADLLIRCRDVDRTLCGAVVDGDLLVSVRTTDRGGDAHELVTKTLAGVGHGGGHQHRAGGKLAKASKGGHVSEDLQAELRSRWLRACGLDQQRGSRLVPARQIIQNL